MNNIRVSFTAILLLLSICVSAKEVTDTLFSAQKDRVIVTYNITQKGNTVELQFRSVNKMLGGNHLRKYKKESDRNRIQTFFFDGTSDDVYFSGISPKTILLPAKASYHRSSDGYFIVEQRPTISFDLGNSEAKSFTIPLYLVYYERKYHYNIFCYCGDLEVRLPEPTIQTSSNPQAGKKPSQQTSIEMVEIEDEIEQQFNEEAIAIHLIELINEELLRQDALPMDVTLEMKVKELVAIQSKINNDKIGKSIAETLESYNNKKKELEESQRVQEEQKAEDNEFAECSTKEQFESYLRKHPNGRHVEEAKSKINDIEDAAKAAKDKEKKRTIWMIVGGVLLAILLFVGNQAMQSFRNIRTQRSMMKMQQDATRRAEYMAKSKAQREIRNQTNKVASQAKKKGQTILRDVADKAKNNNGNNRMSI